jgi:N utilization substance protein A
MPETINFGDVLIQLEKEHGLSHKVLLEAVEAALLSACKKKFKETDNLSIKLDENTGSFKVIAKKTVAETIENPEKQIDLKAARKLKKKAKADEEIEIDVTPSDFGRLAAQTAKQVVVQRIREAEKSTAFDEFKKREGQITSCVVQKTAGNLVLLNLGRAEAILPPSEQIPGEVLRPKDHIKVFVTDVNQTNKGPIINVSRTHPALIRCLFEAEVPEIKDKTILIKAIAREAGKRTKIAVFSTKENVGAVGTCIGQGGVRIQAVSRELGNEKIDVIEFNPDPKTFLGNALKPAKILTIEANEEKKEAKIIVAQDQLSLAIGRNGQNVRLASKLTGWRLDIVGDKEVNEQKV